MDREALTRTARRAREEAHAPYSGYRVGAAVLTEEGVVFAGCNVENASYGLTMCAERVAVGSAVAAGHTRILAVAVAVGGEEPVAPCGACRQVLAEFGGDDLIVVAVAGEATREWRLGELLPGAFRGGALPSDDDNAEPDARGRV